MNGFLVIVIVLVTGPLLNRVSGKVQNLLRLYIKISRLLSLEPDCGFVKTFLKMLFIYF